MYQLQCFPANANAAQHMLLDEIGVKYDLVLVDRASSAQKPKDYLKINPNGRIPTLVDGELIGSEAAAIMLHLVDQFADGGLAPQIGTLERARVYQWLTFQTNSLPDELMISQYPDRLAGRDAFAADVVKQGAEGRASRFLDVIEDHLKANGPLFSRQPAERRRFHLVMLSRWTRPNIATLLDKVTALPSVRRAYEQEGIADEIC